MNNLLRENELLRVKYDCEKEIRCALEKQKNGIRGEHKNFDKIK